MSLLLMTLAYIIGILWGLYLELNTLIITSIFLCFFELMFIRKFRYEIIFLAVISILGCFYVDVKIKEYDNKYMDDMNLNINVVIISQPIEDDYNYKYNCESAGGDKFIIYIKKNSSSDFKIGDSLKIKGKFILPDLARNNGRI